MKSRIYQELKKVKFIGNFQRVEFPIPPMAILPWLAMQVYQQKVYWHDRTTRTEVAGIGCADYLHTVNAGDYFKVFSLISERLSPEYDNMRYYGGFSFSEDIDHDSYWQSFGNNYFVMPRFEILRKDNLYTLAVNFKVRNETDLNDLIEEVEQVREMDAHFASDMPTLINFNHYPDKNNWDKMIGSALDHISKNNFEKIVLARKSRLHFSEKLNPFQIVENLKLINPDSTHFCIQPNSDSCFVGGTPELLYRRNGSRIFSVALAGTRKRGETDAEDEQLEKELLTSEKDLREHRIVINNVHDILRNLCSEIRVGKSISVLKLARIQHLYTSFEGILRDGPTDIEIISRLHPTPAVGGFPTENALPLIEELEPFRRGWYAAPVGWISANAAHFVVAIRSGLIHKQNLYLYSGAGIVAGSDPDMEWEEIENKLLNFLRAVEVNGEFTRPVQTASKAVS